MAEHISIPVPCGEKWDNMEATAQGRYCLSCCKTVTDFTNWEVPDILQYLKTQNKAVCGRFTTAQMQPQPAGTGELYKKIYYSHAPYYSKIAALVVLFFGSVFTSCGTNKSNAKMVYNYADTTKKPARNEQTLIGDTIVSKQDLKIVVPHAPQDEKVIPIPKKEAAENIPVILGGPVILQGDVYIVPDTAKR